MKTFKRIGDDCILVEGVYYSTNIIKKTDILSPEGYKIDSIRINCVFYYPYKIEN